MYVNMLTPVCAVHVCMCACLCVCDVCMFMCVIMCVCYVCVICVCMCVCLCVCACCAVVMCHIVYPNRLCSELYIPNCQIMFIMSGGGGGRELGDTISSCSAEHIQNQRSNVHFVNESCGWCGAQSILPYHPTFIIRCWWYCYQNKSS